MSPKGSPLTPWQFLTRTTSSSVHSSTGALRWFQTCSEFRLESSLVQLNVNLWITPRRHLDYPLFMSGALRSEIYVLTALFKDVQNRRPDGIPRGLQDSRKDLNTSQSTAGKTFQRLATILTRGTEDAKDRIVAVTGGPLNENPLRIYLCTRSPSTSPTISPSTSNETNNNDDEPVPRETDGPLLVAANSSHAEAFPLVREGTLPTVVSEEVKKMLLEQDQQPALASKYADFFDYLPIVFQVLKYAAQGSREERNHAALFFVTQCRDKIRQRVRAILKGYDLGVLREWKPYSYENSFLPPQDLVIKDTPLVEHLEEQQVPLVPGTADQLVFSHEHALKWLKTLLQLLEYIHMLVNTTNASSTQHAELMEGLIRLYILLSKIPRKFWSLQSLGWAVDKSRAAAWDERIMKESYVDDNEDDDDLDDALESKDEWTRLPIPTVRFVRSLYAACACITACHFISRSALLKQPLAVSYRALDLPVDTLGFPLETNLFTEWFRAIKDDEVRKRLIREANTHSKNLVDGTAKGACHCESGFMSALVAQEEDLQSDVPFLGFSRNATRLLEITCELDIGAAKKSCGTCWLLTEVIKETDNIDVRLPGTHARFYPWLPPSYLPERVLCSLRDKLLERLVTMVNRETTMYESRTSFPASAITDMMGSNASADTGYIQFIQACE